MPFLPLLLPSAAGPCRRRAILLAVACTAGVLPVRAQLAWTVFDESTLSPVTSAGDRVSISVPAGQRVTLVSTNIVPFDLTAPSAAPVTLALTFTASGGLSNLAAGQRAIGIGLFNHQGTATNFADDAGYFAWVNGRATGALLELRRRNGDGSSSSLLFPSGTALANLGTGSATQTAGVLTDGVPYTITLRLNRSAVGLSLGTGPSPDVAGVWLRGDGLSQSAYSNPDTPPAATQFNEIAFMFQNTTGAAVALTLNAITGVTPLAAPVIVAQPTSLILNPGQSGTLAVTAAGTPPFSYEWRRGSVPIPGANGSTYSATAAGTYSVVVSNAFGSAISSNAEVIVSATPIPVTIETHPQSLSVNTGVLAVFSVNAFGSAPLTFEWQKNSTAIPGANGRTLTIASATPSDAGVYSVVVRNATTSAISQPATLTVNAPPTILTPPVSLVVAVGDRAQFSVVAASSTGALSYQWLRNGAPLAGATGATLAFASVALADLGTYAVRVANPTGSVLSQPAVLTAPSTMTIVGRFPATGATAVNPDTPLRLTFDREVRVGATGKIQIVRVVDNTVVDTLDLGASSTRLVGSNPTPYAFLPALATGNTAEILPRAGVLAHGQAYRVTVESGVFLDASGATFIGSTESAAWRFSTKNAGPIPGTTAVTVAADGSGDFSTVQGAFDFVPAGNAARVVITVQPGTYHELVYLGATRPFVTLRGTDRAQTIIAYPNNNTFNSGNNRALFACDASDVTLESITLHNTTPAGGSQAEALRGNGQRVVLDRVTLSSFQDTLLWNGTLFVTDSLIEGDVDFMWGGGAVYFQRCELRALGAGYYAQVRNSQTGKGHVYVDCRLTAAAGVGAGSVYLARIDPRDGVTAAWPYSQVVFLNCALGPQIARAGWRLDNAASAPHVQFWEYQSTDLDGATLDVNARLGDSRQLDDATAAQYRDPQFVVGFVPQLGPAFAAVPTPQRAIVGANVRLRVTATGSPAPVYQWLRGGVMIAGATDSTLVLADVQPGDAGDYAVRVSNANGVVTSATAALTVGHGPYAGVYTGTLASSGAFALHVRDDGTAVFLARGAGFAGTLAVRTAAVSEKGRLSAVSGWAQIEGTIDPAGNLSGSVGPDPRSGILAPTLQLIGARTLGTGVAQAFAGYHQLRLAGGSLAIDLVVASTGQAFGVVLGAALDAGSGTVDATGRISVSTTGGQTLTGVLGTRGGGGSATLITPQSGGNRVSVVVAANDAGARAQRLTGLATRARAGAGDSAAIVGFVISGDAPRPVVIRGIGPTLGTFGVATALTVPKLDLYRGADLVATNTGWAAGGNAPSLAAAFSRVGLFALNPASADSALALTLAPGAYTAQITGVGGAEGNALVEIYDLAPDNLAQRLSNLSTRALAGRGDDTLIGGMIVAGNVPKRMLVRAVGPGLTQFGVGGALRRPLLSIFQGDVVIVQNSNWSTSPEAASIALASVESGAFPLAPAAADGGADAALLLNLAPGNYTAQVTGADGSTGFALLEIYELP